MSAKISQIISLVLPSSKKLPTSTPTPPTSKSNWSSSSSRPQNSSTSLGPTSSQLEVIQQLSIPRKSQTSPTATVAPSQTWAPSRSQPQSSPARGRVETSPELGAGSDADGSDGEEDDDQEEEDDESNEVRDGLMNGREQSRELMQVDPDDEEVDELESNAFASGAEEEEEEGLSISDKARGKQRAISIDEDEDESESSMAAQDDSIEPADSSQWRSRGQVEGANEEVGRDVVAEALTTLWGASELREKSEQSEEGAVSSRAIGSESVDLEGGEEEDDDDEAVQLDVEDLHVSENSRKRKRGKDEPSSDEDLSDLSDLEEEEQPSYGQGETMSDEELSDSDLNNPRLVHSYNTATLNDDDEEVKRVRVGDVVKLFGGTNEDWLAKIESIVAPKAITEPSPRASKGKKASQATKIYLRPAWLYSKSQFLELGSDKPAGRLPKSILNCLGDQERVLTDHATWNHQENIDLAGNQGAIPVINFDDQYPSSLSISHHPLSHLASPQTIKSNVMPPLPSFFFGDGGDKDLKNTPWVRTTFQFAPIVKIAPVKKDYGVRGRKKAKYLTEEVAMRKEKEKKNAGKKVVVAGPPLSLNRHSGTYKKPYNPSTPQYFSPTAQLWFDVTFLPSKLSNLARAKHDSLPPSPSDTDDEPNPENEEEDEANLTDYEEPPSSSFLKSPKKVKFRSRTPSEKSISADSSTWDWKDRKYLPPSGLYELGRSSMVRGGSYGLIGNSYLVTRAKEIIKSLSEGEGGEDAVEEGRRLVRDWEKWKKAVGKRERKPKEEWVAGSPGERETWICPVSTFRL